MIFSNTPSGRRDATGWVWLFMITCALNILFENPGLLVEEKAGEYPVISYILSVQLLATLFPLLGNINWNSPGVCPMWSPSNSGKNLFMLCARKY